MPVGGVWPAASSSSTGDAVASNLAGADRRTDNALSGSGQAQGFERGVTSSADRRRSMAFTGADEGRP